jgi:hypothetical protein
MCLLARGPLGADRSGDVQVKPHLWRQVFKNLDSLGEPFTFEDCKQVIDGRVELWKHEPSMAAHLNPTTIFNPKKFFSYLGAGTRAGRGRAVDITSRATLERDAERIEHEGF